MSLTTGRGPLEPPPRRALQPARCPRAWPTSSRSAAACAGSPAGPRVVDSERVLLVHRPGQPPTYAFPAGDVRPGRPGPSRSPTPPVTCRVPWDAVDTWYEEDEQVFGHPRNPYHRVDCVRTRRRLRVEVAGTTLVDTDATLGVYETALRPAPVRRPRPGAHRPARAQRHHHLLPLQGHRLVLERGRSAARPSPTSPGPTSDPLPESLPLRGLLAFDPARATVDQALPPTAAGAG